MTDGPVECKTEPMKRRLVYSGNVYKGGFDQPRVLVCATNHELCSLAKLYCFKVTPLMQIQIPTGHL